MGFKVDELKKKISLVHEYIVQASEFQDTFPEVLVEELQLMKSAFEKKLKDARKEIEAMRSSHNEAMKAMHDTTRSERLLLEMKIRRLTAELEELKLPSAGSMILLSVEPTPTLLFLSSSPSS